MLSNRLLSNGAVICCSRLVVVGTTRRSVNGSNGMASMTTEGLVVGGFVSGTVLAVSDSAVRDNSRKKRGEQCVSRDSAGHSHFYGQENVLGDGGGVTAADVGECVGALVGGKVVAIVAVFVGARVGGSVLGGTDEG